MSTKRARFTVQWFMGPRGRASVRALLADPERRKRIAEQVEKNNAVLAKLRRTPRG